MAKKQAARKSDGTVAFQVRFDADLHTTLKEHADQAGISLNQLIQGICRGVSESLHQGEAVFDREGFVKVNDVKGCLFAGVPGYFPPSEELADVEEEHTGVRPSMIPRKGVVWFGLDFTNRGLVRFAQKND